MHLRTLLAAVLLLVARATAHDGPPYAVLVDQPCGPRRIEVWADPDIGTGTFLILLGAPAGSPPLPPPDEVHVAVTPRDGHLPERAVAARRDDGARDQRWLAEVEFDAGDWWTARFLVRDAAGTHAAAVDVEVTPPGVGLLGFLIYLFPFVAFGLLFLKLALGRRRQRAAAAG